MSKQVSIEKIGAIEHVDPHAILRGQIVCTTTFRTDDRWQLWFISDGRIFPMQIVDLSEGAYFGDGAAAPHDLRLQALNLIAQHACFGETAKPFMGIWDDLYNIAASVAKLDLVMAHQSGQQPCRLSTLVIHLHGSSPNKANPTTRAPTRRAT